MAGGDDRDGESFAALFERSAGSEVVQHRFRRGERVEVTVVAISRDAVFADLGGKQEGYFDRVELAGPDGKLRVEVGARISAVVSDVDENRAEVRLSPVFVRQASDTPEARVDEELGVAIPVARSGPLLVEGARISGKVTGIERYGIFVQIDGTSGRGGRGLVPTPESGTPRGSDLKKHFAVGQEVAAKILNIAEDGKIRLSIAALAADEEHGDYEKFRAGADQPEDAAADASSSSAGQARPGKPAEKRKPEPRGFGTLGDLLGKRAQAAPPPPPLPAAGPAPRRPAAKKADKTSR
jgi:small subunit ribosomal protein S1